MSATVAVDEEAPVPADLLVVLVWREAGSPRLRTYTTDDTYRPLLIPLSEVFPPPSEVITDSDALHEYLSAPPPPPSDGPLRSPVVAVPDDLAREVLGWSPALPSPS